MVHFGSGNQSGWVNQPTGARNDWWVPGASSWSGNVHWSGAVTAATETAEYAYWQNKLSANGVNLLQKTEHGDTTLIVDHAVPNCVSREVFRAVLDDRAHSVFQGRIIVRPDAQKTNSRQVNRNLLLSESAIIDSKPTLEIHNDDVKCSHGSTIGQLDEEALFYLRARGIGESDARNLMIYAFASEIIDRMKAETVKETVRAAMFQRIPKGLADRRSAAR